MTSKFEAVPLFDTYSAFYNIDKYDLFPQDTPVIESFVKEYNETVNSALDDYRHVKNFLWSKCRKSEATYNAFRSEAERFLLWAWCIHGKSVVQMKKRDIEDYIEFIIKPPHSWIGKKIVRRFQIRNGIKQVNPEWRPFVVKISKAERKTKQSKTGETVKLSKSDYTISQKSRQEVFSNLSVMYSFLVEEDYAFGNMIGAVKKSSPHLIVDVSNEGVKRLSNLQWEYVLEAAKEKTEEDPQWERHLFIIACMKSLYLRVSELSCRKNWIPTMGHFYPDAENDWWFTAFGKGNKKRKVSVPKEFLEYLRRYRASIHLDGLPSRGETTPLLKPIRKHSNGLGPRMVAAIAQEAFDEAAKKLRKDGFDDDASTLLATSTHWLRHTGASMDIKTRPLVDLSADLGHEKISTTDKEYVHADDRERATSGRGRRV